MGSEMCIRDRSYYTDQLMTPFSEIFQVGAHETVHLVGIDGRELSVGRLAGFRSPFTESALIALDV